MVALWRRFQKITIMTETKEQSQQVQVTFAMPVFLVLGLGVFAWVIFSNPIESELTLTPKPAESAETDSGNDSLGQDGTLGTLSDPITIVQRTAGFAGGGGEIFQLRMNALVAGIAALQANTSAENNRHFAQLVTFRDEVLLEFYGQSLMDNCRNLESEDYEDQTCQNIRRWES